MPNANCFCFISIFDSCSVDKDFAYFVISFIDNFDWGLKPCFVLIYLFGKNNLVSDKSWVRDNWGSFNWGDESASICSFNIFFNLLVLLSASTSVLLNNSSLIPKVLLKEFLQLAKVSYNLISFLPSLEEFNVHNFLALIDALLHIANTLISIHNPSNILNGIIYAIFPDLTALRVILKVWLLWPSTNGSPSIFIFWGSSIKKGISLSPSLKKVISLDESVLYLTSPKSIAVLLIFILGNTDMNLIGTLKNGFLFEIFTTNVYIIGSSSIYSSIRPEIYELNFFISLPVGSLYTITVFSYYEKA